MKTEFDKAHHAHKYNKFTLGPIGLMLLLKTGWGRSVGAITPNRCRPWISTINELMLQLKPTLACSNTAHSGSLMVILEEGGDTLMSQSGAVMETNKREAQKNLQNQHRTKSRECSWTSRHGVSVERLSLTDTLLAKH